MVSTRSRTGRKPVEPISNAVRRARTSAVLNHVLDANAGVAINGGAAPWEFDASHAGTSDVVLQTADSLIASRFREIATESGVLGRATWYRFAKRSLDISASLLLLAALSPLLLLIALIVRLDSDGSVLFVQQRVGQRGRIFGMLKFRTMFSDQSYLLDGPVHKHDRDPRVTRVGRFLRATSLDEVPQLINVVRGDMSLVGPRPEIVEIALKHYEPWQYLRLLVPQGMTGWWQVTGRSTKLMRQNTGDDLYYVERASFWFDLKILALTLRAVIRREGAF